MNSSSNVQAKVRLLVQLYRALDFQEHGGDAEHSLYYAWQSFQGVFFLHGTSYCVATMR